MLPSFRKQGNSAGSLVAILGISRHPKHPVVTWGYAAVPSERVVSNPEATGNLEKAACGYTAGRISSSLKGSTKQFGWLQGPATKNSFLSITSAKPATIRICSLRC